MSSSIPEVIKAELEKSGIRTLVVDVAKIGISATTYAKDDIERLGEWQKIMAAADGLVIVAPEYNHGYPGELKLAFDSLYQEYHRKPIAVCGVSTGALGGARMVESFHDPIVAVHAVPICSSVYFDKVGNLFDESGRLKDERYIDRMKTMIDELAWFAAALKTARNQ